MNYFNYYYCSSCRCYSKQTKNAAYFNSYGYAIYSYLHFLLKIDVNIDVEHDQLSKKDVNLAVIGGFL